MVTCNYCKRDFKPKDKRYNKFCSRSCSVSFNNRKTPKRKKRFCICKCGKEMAHVSKNCRKCHKKNYLKLVLSKPIKDFYSHGLGNGKYNAIRTWARNIWKHHNKPFQCQVCGFKTVVHIDHIKGIAEFDENVLMSVVNGLDNLQCLCPNHHAVKELQRKIILSYN